MTHAFQLFLSLVAARTAVIFLVLLLGLRVLGKRQIGQMNIYDLAMVMAVANAVQNAMTGGNGNLSVGIVSAGMLIMLGSVFSLLFVRLPRLEERIVGTPTLLIHNGRWLERNLQREKVTHNQVLAAMRQHGVVDPAEVEAATLEVDGDISIVPRSRQHSRIPVKRQRRTSNRNVQQ